jgi:hypothetical protein
MQKVVHFKLHYPRPIPSMLVISTVLEKKFILHCGLLHRMRFEFEYVGGFEI